MKIFQLFLRDDRTIPPPRPASPLPALSRDTVREAHGQPRTTPASLLVQDGMALIAETTPNDAAAIAASKARKARSIPVPETTGGAMAVVPPINSLWFICLSKSEDLLSIRFC